MPTSGEILRGIDNVQFFKEVATRHSQGLVRDGYVWQDPVPMFLRPYTEVSRGYPHNKVVRNDFIQGVATGRAIDEEDHAPLGERDIFGIEMLEPVMLAGHSMRVTPKTLREAMAQDRVGQMISQPFEEWARASAEEMLDLAVMGAFSSATDDPSDSHTVSFTTFDGAAVAQRYPTDSADTARALTANSNHSVQFANRSGGLFSAGHDHVDVGVGGVWTRARGRTARDDITEHPGQNAVDAFVGGTVAGAVLDELEAGAGLDSSGVSQIPAGQDFLATGRDSLVGADFGMPIPLGTVDQVRYWSVTDIPDTIGMFVARGSQPFRSFFGLRNDDGRSEPPFSWTESLHRELRGSNGDAGIDYGFRGEAGHHVQNPVGASVVEFTA